jgi:hypothetical protein
MNVAVMRQVQGEIRHQFNSANDYAADDAPAAEEQADIDRMFSWSRRLPDKAMASCYEHWLGYFGSA